MVEYCAINLNAGCRLNSRDDTSVFSKNISGYIQLCIFIDINLSKTVADDLLLSEKI